MSDKTIRHLTAFFATFATALSFLAGYYAGPRGWWWVIIVVFVIYYLVYKLVDK